MKNFLAVAAAVVAMGLASASAAVVDFGLDADTNGERAAPNGLNINGVIMNFSATPGQAVAYLDASSGGLPAGLGVCKVIANGDCNPSSDDNVTEGESVTISFVNGPFDLSNFTFRDENHNVLAAATDSLLISVNGGAAVLYTFAQAIGLSFNAVSTITFAYNSGQFYVNSFSANNVIPIPGALPLLISGLAGLGFAARRKKAA